MSKTVKEIEKKIGEMAQLKIVPQIKANSCFFAAIEAIGDIVKHGLKQKDMIVLAQGLCDPVLGTAAMDKEKEICDKLDLEATEINFADINLKNIPIGEAGIFCTSQNGNHCYGFYKKSEGNFELADSSAIDKYKIDDLLVKFNNRKPMILILKKKNKIS